MARDIHSQPFDDGTKIKLELFRLYLRQWFPVFIQRRVRQFEIYDFFAGEGSDSIGTPGSPLIILDELKTYCQSLQANNTNVVIHLNDSNSRKVETLNTKIETAIKACSAEKRYDFCNTTNGRSDCPFTLKVTREDFITLFDNLYPDLFKNYNVPRFIFIDQYGIKYVNNTVFDKLVSLSQADFLFFISSSHLVRFKDQPEFAAYLKTNLLDFSEASAAECHRVIYDYFKKMLEGRHFFLGQFSIKKDSNYYGLIFGSHHPLGMRKFLDVAWKIDPHTGETNHDIDGDPIRTGTLEFDFDGTGSVNRTKKLTAYENTLKLFMEIPRSNKSIYLFSLENGISISKTNEILRSLEKSGKLAFEGDQRHKGGFYLDFDPDKNISIQIK